MGGAAGFEKGAEGVSERATPSIEDLEERHAPCFLWDSARLRIVWANAAGLEVFSAETLFDLIDRPFHANEPGAARIGELGSELASGSPRRELLLFPSTGRSEPIAVTCFLHPLADGRAGVLVVGENPAGDRRGGLEDVAQAFAALPVAALLIDADGAIAQHNTAAAEFVGHLRERTFGQLFGDEAAAADFAQRLRNSGSLSQVQTIHLPIGRRDVRMAGRICDGQTGDSDRFVIILEDVTERRALERTLSAKPARSQAAGDRKPALPTPDKRPATIESPPATVSAAKDADDIPAIVKARFETTGEAVFILRGGELLHANDRALRMLGYGSVTALKARRDIVALLNAAGPRVAITDAGGAAQELTISKAEIPWLNGPATLAKVVIAPASAPPAEAAKAEQVATVREPATQVPEEAKHEQETLATPAAATKAGDRTIGSCAPFSIRRATVS